MERRVPLPSWDEINDTWRYDHITGELFWKKRGRKRLLHKPAGNFNSHGYRVVNLNHQEYKVHRLIWKLLYGTEPEHLDHKDRDKGNNTQDNLRDVSKSGNSLNMASRVGRVLPKGISVDKGNYSARIRLEGKSVHLGNFATIAEASEAYERANQKYFEVAD